MVSDEEPQVARKIPPKIAEAVAGMELVGADLVDRRAILGAIDALKGESFSERLADQLSRSIGQKAITSMAETFANSAAIEATKSSQALANSLANNAAVTGMAKTFANSAASAAIEATKSSQALANSLANKSALAWLTKTFETSGLKAVEEATRTSHAMMENLVDKSALNWLTKSFESSAMKAVEEAARTSHAMMENLVDKSALNWLTKSFESSAMKAVEEAARTSQEIMENIASSNVIGTFKVESQTLDRLVRQMNETGWLVPTDTRGMWEFAPGSRAGSFRSSDTFMPLKAALAKNPDLKVTVSMESAAFLHKLSEHSPRKGVIAVPKGTSRKGALSQYRHINIQLPESATVVMDGIPVHSIAGLLAAMAVRPMSYRDWPNVLKWLPDACNKIITSPNKESGSLGGKSGLFEMLKTQPTTVVARVAYFFRITRHDSIARTILDLISKPYDGPIYLGYRNSVKKYATYDSFTKVYDNLLEIK